MIEPVAFTKDLNNNYQVLCYQDFPDFEEHKKTIRDGIYSGIDSKTSLYVHCVVGTTQYTWRVDEQLWNLVGHNANPMFALRYNSIEIVLDDE